MTSEDEVANQRHEDAEYATDRGDNSNLTMRKALIKEEQASRIGNATEHARTDHIRLRPA